MPTEEEEKKEETTKTTTYGNPHMPELPSGFVLNSKNVLVIMRVGEAKLVHTFKRPTLNQWSDYLRDLKPGFILSEDKGWAAKNDESFAASEMWNELVVGVKGYRGKAGWLDGDWKKKIPVKHKMTGIQFLQDVWVEDSQEGGNEKDDEGKAVFDLEADTRTVILAGTSDGFKFDRLAHILKVPLPEQEIRFERTRIHYIRQSGDSNRVISPPRLRKMAELYDELIESVEGYAIENYVQNPPENTDLNATEIKNISDATDARRYMDPLHKQAAVLATFSQQPVGERVGADSGRGEADEIED